ncbi:MAG TPA: hypothetical protein VG734_20990 [Lacunisphaera sp.]|nr:hypothetical protein [Lacunisphaera sp.]
MLARVSMLLLLAGIVGAETVQPKERPRLPAPVVTEIRREADRANAEPGAASPFRSFDDFLQAGARRPLGMEAFRETRAAPAGSGGTGISTAAKDSSSTPARNDATSADVLVLPKMEVNAEKISKLKTELAKLEASQSWWSKSAESWENRTVVDAILNPPFLRLGGYSGEGRAAVARQRVELLRWVKILEISLEEARTPVEKARIQSDIDSIAGIMRMWE